MRLWDTVAECYRFIEKRWISNCDGAIGASWSITEYLRTILDSCRTETILNVPAVDVFGEGSEREWGETTILCHDGFLGFDRGLKTIVRAAHMVSRKHPVILKIVGDVFNEERSWLEDYLAYHGLGSLVVRTGWLPYPKVGHAIAGCHIGISALQYLPNNIVTSSNKVFNYMMYGIPFVGPAFRLAKIKLVQEEQCGVLADSSSPESYAAAIIHMIEHREDTKRMGQNALRASREKYRWEHMEPRLFSLYERVITSG